MGSLFGLFALDMLISCLILPACSFAATVVCSNFRLNHVMPTACELSLYINRLGLTYQSSLLKGEFLFDTTIG